MSTLFSISSGNLTDNIFARTIAAADITSVTDVMGIGNTPLDVTSFTSDGSTIWGISFNVKSRADNATGLFSCKLYDSMNVERGSCVVPISNFPPGDGSNNIENAMSQTWQTLKFDAPVNTTTGSSFYIRLSSNTDSELYFYGLPQLDQSVVDYASGLDVVATGNATQNSFNPYNVKSWAWFMNDGGYISYPSSVSFLFGISAFTIDFWCYLSETRVNRILSLVDFNVDVGASNTLLVAGTNTNLSLTQNSWNHIAITRSGDVMNGYVNGIKSSNIALTPNKVFAQNTFFIGRDRTDPSICMHGYVFNLRVTKGQELYSSNFSVPTEPSSRNSNGGATPSNLPTGNNVSLLILSDENRLEDQANKRIQTVGSAGIVKRNPWVDNLPSILVLNSFYSTNKINTDQSPGTGPFTLECFLYMHNRNSLSYVNLFLSLGDGTFGGPAGSTNNCGIGNWDTANTLVYMYDNSNAIRFLETVDIRNTWQHFAICRDNSNTTRFYRNGILKFTRANDTKNYGTAKFIGNSDIQRAASFSISNCRMVLSALYTQSSFEVPQIPLKNIDNTTLLFAERSSQKRLVNYGNRNQDFKIATGQDISLVSNPNSVGTGMIEFTNTAAPYGMYVRDAGNLLNNDPYTLEFNIIFTRLAVAESIIATGNEQASLPGYEIIKTTANVLQLTIRDTGTTSTTHIIMTAVEMSSLLNTKIHIAVVRSGDTMDIFVNGELKASGAAPAFVNNGNETNVLVFGNRNWYNGSDDVQNFNNKFVGYMDNIAISNTKKYLGTFTPNGAISIKDSILYITGDDISISKDIIPTVGNVSFPLNFLWEQNVGDPNWESASKYSTAIDYDITYFDYEESTNYGISSTANFTLECWFNVKNYNNASIVSVLSNGGFYLNALSGKPSFGITGGSPLVSATGRSLSTQPYRWHHLAVTRDSGTLRMYVNGVLSGTKLNDTTEFNSGILRVGGEANKNSFFDGILLGLRLTKDQALYTTNFTTASTYVTTSNNGGATPSTNPLSSNVAFLLCNSNTVDTNTRLNPTIAGTSTLVAVPSAIGLPFNNEEIYNTSQHAGSIFFDNTGDLVTVSERSDEFTFGNSDFTIEYWYFPYTIAANDEMVKTFSGTTNLADGIKFYYANATTPTVDIGNDGVVAVSFNAIRNTLKQWNHFALTRKSGTVRFFINGDLVGATNFGGIVLQNDNDALIMGTNCHGYISDARIIKGQALYTDKFIPPSASLTLAQNGATGIGAVALTTTPNLLIKGTTAGIYDGSANNTFTLSGGTFRVSLNETINANSNYADNTLIFNGVFNNNFIIIPPSPSLNLAGDFWIDFWMNTSKFKQDTEKRRILTLGNQDSVSAFQICINVTGSDKKLQILSNTNILSSNFDYADGLWHHVGIGRNGSTLSLYRDGVLDRSVTNNIDFDAGVANNSYIGIYGAAANPSTGRYGGKLVGLRIINGECVHTSNYTLPASPATLTSDGGIGTNDAGNVSLFMKLNNVVSPVNSHVIVSATQSITGAITSPSTNNFSVYTNIVSSSDLPTGATAGTRSISFNAISGSAIDATTSNFQMSGDWTFEGFFKPLTGTNSNGYRRMIMNFNSDNFHLSYLSGAYYLYFQSIPLTLSAAGTLNAYSHVAACRKGNEISLYVGGTRTANSSATIDNATIHRVFKNSNLFTLGCVNGNGDVGRYHGFMYRPRIIDGRSVYSGTSFTPPSPASISATADTVFLYTEPNENIYFNPGYLEKVVIGGNINAYSVTPIRVNCNVNDYAFNNMHIQNNGTLVTTGSANSEFRISNDGFKIGSGGTFILSALSAQQRIINMDNTRIHVLPCGTMNVRGLQKTSRATLTGFSLSGSNVFTLNETPTNWLSGDSLIFLPSSANRTQFEELTARRSLTNRLSTTTTSIYNHQRYSGVPTIANGTRNIRIKGLSPNRRGWIQFDKTSNTNICDTELELLGIDGRKTESLILNVKEGGSFLLSGCYIDGSTSTNVDAINFYGKSYNINLIDNVFYKHSGDSLNFNRGITNLNVKNNLILSSSGNGIRLENATISGNVTLENNISLGNNGRGTYLDNVDGIILGSTNWMNGREGLYLGNPTKGESFDLVDEDTTITENILNTVALDNPFGSLYPDETSTYFISAIKWDPNSIYNFEGDFTFEAFYKFPSAIAATSYIFVCGNNSGLAGYSPVGSSLGSFRLEFIPETYSFSLSTNEGTNTSKFTGTPTFFRYNQWFHIALVRKDDLMALYFDGKKIASYTTNFEFKSIAGNIGLFANTNPLYVYGFRVLTRAEYETAQNTITVPTAPFEVDNDTVLLYKRTVKTGPITLGDIKSYYNASGVFIDNTLPGLKNTTISNISCVNNTSFGFAISGSNSDYRTPNVLTASNIYIDGSSTVGLDIVNMAGTLSGVYVSNSTISNIRLKIGEGKTKITAVTGLMGNNNENMVIHSSKSYQPVLFDNIVLSKSALLTSAYLGIPLTLGNTEFINFNFDNSTLSTVNTGFAVSLSGSVLGSYQFSNTMTTSAGVTNLSCLPPYNIKSGGIIFMNKNKNAGSHESFYRTGKRATDTSLVGGNVAEKISPLSITDKFKSGSKFVAVSTNDVVDLKIKVAVTNNYNGSNPRFVLKKNRSLGFEEDQVLYTFPETTSYSETLLSTPSASGVGVMEFFVDCDGTAGSVIIDEWKAK